MNTKFSSNFWINLTQCFTDVSLIPFINMAQEPSAASIEMYQFPRVPYQAEEMFSPLTEIQSDRVEQFMDFNYSEL